MKKLDKKEVIEFFEAVLFCVFMWGFLWLYCRLTPAQMSAEYDLAVQEGAQAQSAHADTSITGWFSHN